MGKNGKDIVEPWIVRAQSGLRDPSIQRGERALISRVNSGGPEVFSWMILKLIRTQWGESQGLMKNEFQGHYREEMVPTCHSPGISDLVQSRHFTFKGTIIQGGQANLPRSIGSILAQWELQLQQRPPNLFSCALFPPYYALGSGRHIM